MSDEPFELEERYLDRLLAIRDHEGADAPAGYQRLLDEIDGHILVARAEGSDEAVADYVNLRQYVKDLI